MAMSPGSAPPLARIYVPVGQIGYGFPESSLERARGWKPDLIAADAGSTDPGPSYLATGKSFTSRAMVKRDIGLLLPVARQLGIPLVIGTAGGSGAAPHLAWALDILREVAAEARLSARVAVIEAEPDRAYLERKLAAGEIVDFEAGRELTAADLAACEHVVAQMGLEPIADALAAGAEVVLAGRAFDAALPAALPIERGVDPGVAWHMGKILECGSLVALPRASDGVLAEVYADHFVIEPADPEKRCTVETVAAHTLYEKSDPYTLSLPGGKLDVRNAVFARVDDRSVRVSGSRFVPSGEYFVKLEGAALAGYRSICIAGTRDPIMIDHLDDVLARARLKIANDLAGSVGDSDYQLLFRVYGRDGVMAGREPYNGPPPHELGLVIEVIGKTQEVADTVCALARSATLHLGYEGRMATAGNLAFPYSPAEFPAPPAYEFRVYHLMRVDDPREPFRTRWETL